MIYIEKTILVALLLLFGLCVIVGAVLRHQIGGFLRTIADEAREEREREEREAQAREAAAPDEEKQTKQEHQS